MLFDSQVLAFCAVAALVTISPGPDTFLVIRNTLGGGVRGGIATVLGIVAGGTVHALLAALGLTLILVQSAQAFFRVKVVGAAYLVYLGVQKPAAGIAPGGGVDAARGEAGHLAAARVRRGLRLTVSRATSSLTRPAVRRGLDVATGTIFTGLGLKLALEHRT